MNIATTTPSDIDPDPVLVARGNLHLHSDCEFGPAWHHSLEGARRLDYAYQILLEDYLLVKLNSRHSNRLERLDCGCLRYCDSCTDSRLRDDDIVDFSRNLTEFLGEGWADLGRWEAIELTASELFSE